MNFVNKTKRHVRILFNRKKSMIFDTLALAKLCLWPSMFQTDELNGERICPRMITGLTFR